MFTGIIETLAKLEKVEKENSNLMFTFSCTLASELKVDQSVAHNGVCLTVTSVNENFYTVTVIDETLKRSNLGLLKPGEEVNIERCMPANGRFDGHIVQGHVDTTAECRQIKNLNGSWEFEFFHELNPDFVTVKKGSVTVNGVSLTVVNSGFHFFTVHIIPYTFAHTTFKNLGVGDRVNIEFDIIGKYLRKMNEFKATYLSEE